MDELKYIDGACLQKSKEINYKQAKSKEKSLIRLAKIIKDWITINWINYSITYTSFSTLLKLNTCW